MIDTHVARFLEEGLDIHIGTRNARLQPNGARAIAATVEGDGEQMVVYVATIAVARLLPDLESNGLAAVSFARATDDRACQVKGEVLDVRPATEADRQLMTAQLGGALEKLERIGIPPAMFEAWATWPAVAIRLRVTAVFDQTPGPKAGTVME
jgi:hypothetical protein